MHLQRTSLSPLQFMFLKGLISGGLDEGQMVMPETSISQGKWEKRGVEIAHA